ncbi:PHP-associated domain-containing protein [Salibacterium sp. K-3]
MNMDLHTHGKLTKKTDFDLEFFRNMAAGAAKNGLDAFALTEHFNTRNFREVYDTLDAHFPYVNNYYDVDGLRVFPGMEVDVKETGHILLIGEKAAVLALNDELEPFKEDFISFEELLRLTEEKEMVRIGAHPFRESTPLLAHPPRLLEKLDAFDVNGKDLFTYENTGMKERVQKWADELGIRATAGSDAHHPLQLGAVHNEVPSEIETIGQLKEAVLAQPDLHVSPCLSTKVEAAKYVKKTLKQHVLSV